MTFLHKILLTISLTSLSLCAMNELQKEQGKSLIKLSGATNLYEIQDLYRKTHNTLDNYNSNDHETFYAIQDIIKRMQKLSPQSANDLKLFAYYDSHDNHHIFNLTKPPYNNAHYIIVCLERILYYNAHIQQEKLVSPNRLDFLTYQRNHKIIDATRQASSLHIPLNLEKITKETNLITELPKNTAFSLFNDLLNDITTIRETNPDSMKWIAFIIAELTTKNYNTLPMETKESDSSEEL